MKFSAIFLLLSLRAFSATDAQMIQAIEMTEASYGQVGRAGEIMPSQLSPATVRDHGTDPLANLRWLKKQLARKGVAVIPFNIALCWNAGLTGATTGKAPISSYRYALRMVAHLEQISGSPYTNGRPETAEESPAMPATQPIIFTLQHQ
jgi:hypothetical protein